MTQRILVDTTSTVSVSLYADGELVDPASAVTYTVTSFDGTLIDSGVAAKTGTGVYSVALDALQAPDQLTVAWTAMIGGNETTLRKQVEIVGGFYTSLEDIRASDTSLAGATSEQLDAARAEAEDEAERIMGRCFTRRYAVDRRLRVDDAGNVRTAWPHINTIRKIVATLYGDALTTSAAACKIVGDELVHVGLPAGSLVELHYEHGLDGDFAAGVVGAVRIRARQFVQGSNSRVPLYSERVTIDANGSTVTRMLPKANSTGVAEVDAVYSAHSLNFGIS